jgi:hypothetical protein
MDLIADILLVAGAFGAAGYCSILSARLKRFSALETGMGAAIAVLSAQVDDMTVALSKAQGAAGGSVSRLEDLTARAQEVAAKLELLVASMHDLPQPADLPPETEDRSDPHSNTGGQRRRLLRRRGHSPLLEAAE